MPMYLIAGKGITGSEANHLANLAKELVEQGDRELANYSTLTKKCHTERGKELPMKTGICDTAKIGKQIDLRSRLYRMSAWYREANKERERMFELLQAEVPEFPPAPLKPATVDEVSDGWAFLQMSTKDRAAMLAAEATAAAIGTYIHGHGLLPTLRAEVAEEELQTDRRFANALVVVAHDRVAQEGVDKLFGVYQGKHRKAEKELNSFRARIHDQVNTENKRRGTENANTLEVWRAALKEHEAECAKIRAEHQAKVAKETQEISALKVIVPHELKEIHDFVVASVATED